MMRSTRHGSVRVKSIGERGLVRPGQQLLVLGPAARPAGGCRGGAACAAVPRSRADSSLAPVERSEAAPQRLVERLRSGDAHHVGLPVAQVEVELGRELGRRQRVGRVDAQPVEGPGRALGRAGVVPEQLDPAADPQPVGQPGEDARAQVDVAGRLQLRPSAPVRASAARPARRGRARVSSPMARSPGRPTASAPRATRSARGARSRPDRPRARARARCRRDARSPARAERRQASIAGG